jgi:putative endonuclease
MIYLYILYSKTWDKFYVGQTSDYESRLLEHNTSLRNTYTKKYRPWEIYALFEVKGGISEATKLERFIKAQKSKNLICQIANPDVELIDKLSSLVRVPKLRD